MTEPDDFALSPLATLAHVAAPVHPPAFNAFWQHWHTHVAAHTPRLTEFRAPSPDASDASATHWIESIGHVRLGCRLITPPRSTPTRAALLTLHAYRAPIPLSGEDDDWHALAARGVAILAIRLRGYPGSRLDCADYTAHPAGWIARGLDVPTDRPQDLMDWSLPQGIADAALAAIALRAHLDALAPNQHLPLFLHGTSFGGGIAALAAAQLETLHKGHARAHRLVLALPSLADWPFRLAHAHHARAGTLAGDIRAALTAHAARESELIDRLALVDAVAHAHAITCPTLALLALRDDTVPAPTAAALINILATNPGERFRFLAPYGHFDGGLRNARRHAMFPACRDDFLDPAATPVDAMARWAPVLERGDRRP